MTEPIAEQAHCDRCFLAVPEAHRTRLAIRLPGTAAPEIRFICPDCMKPFVAFLRPDLAAAEGRAEDEAGPIAAAVV